MPRKPRIEFSGAFYHVIVRGNQKQRIFKDADDFRKYLLTLTVYKNRAASRIYAYVLMNNHVHLLIETGDIPLSKVMQGLNQTYTMYFNQRYRTVGHLFQGRYKAILCDRDAYLVGLVKYIHHNPLRAKLVDRLDAYAWSSHHEYVGKHNTLGIVDTNQVLKMFSECVGRARSKYREFMAEKDGYERSDVYATVDQRLKGDEQFVERVVKEHTQEIVTPSKRKVTLAAIAAAIQKQYEVGLEEMRSRLKDLAVARARKVFGILAHDHGYKAVEIGRYLEKDATRITRYLQARNEVKKDVKEAGQLL